MKKILALVSILFSLQNYSFSQDKHFIDSLETQLKNHNAKKLELNLSSPSLYDTIAVKIFNNLSIAYRGNNPDKAMDYANKCLAISEQISYKKGMGDAYGNMGIITLTRINISDVAIRISDAFFIPDFFFYC